VSDGQESTPPTPAPTSGIVGALMEVMQKRSKAIHSSGIFHVCKITAIYCAIFLFIFMSVFVTFLPAYSVTY
jgi:hypothetical protein